MNPETIDKILWLVPARYSAKEIKKLYAIEEQRRIFRNVLGSDILINEKKKFFLTKGHVVARHFYNSIHQQILTFNYVNISPQWSSINSGNMNITEQVIWMNNLLLCNRHWNLKYLILSGIGQIRQRNWQKHWRICGRTWDFAIRTFRHKRTEGIVFGCEPQEISNPKDILFLCCPRKHRFGCS